MQLCFNSFFHSSLIADSIFFLSAIKKVGIDDDLVRDRHSPCVVDTNQAHSSPYLFSQSQSQEDLINEINIMKQCQSDYIVSYYGSYFKDNDLWVRFS
jgi:hypothetical protein